MVAVHDHTVADDVESIPAARLTARRPSLSVLVGAGFTLWGVLIGIQPLHDNSFLTHLATGRLILRDGAIPRTDPFSFSAHGEPWVVQSWLATAAYAWAERLAGLGGIRVFNAVIAAAAAALVWRLTQRAASLLPRVLIAAVACAVGTGVWVERPLLIGLVCLGLLIVLVEGRGDLRWLVPLMWVWVNCHGSFPLGIAFIVAFGVGRRIEGERSTRDVAALGWTVAGTLLGAAYPLGVKLLLFPLAVLQKSPSFQVVQEWKPPPFDNPWQIIFAFQVLIAAGLLMRSRQWRYIVPMVGFVVLAGTSARNIVPASLVLVPGMAAAARGLGTISGGLRPRLARPALVGIIALGLLLASSSLGGPDTQLAAYPEAGVTWLKQHQLLDRHVVAPDYVGNYLEARYRGQVQVFVDDRVDMFPESIVADEVVLLRGRSGWEDVLTRYRAGAVIWRRDKPLTPLLTSSPRWQMAWHDKRWAIFLPEPHAA